MATNNNSFGLTDRNIFTLHTIFEQYPEVTEVRIFGSRAKGNYTTGSDIDLAIMNPEVNQKTITRILSDIEDSSLPYKVDLVAFHSLKTPEFVDHIERKGVLFYKKDK